VRLFVDVDGLLLIDTPLQENRTWALPLTASARRYREAIRKKVPGTKWGGYFRRYSQMKPVLSSFMNCVRCW
jgi:hypothetical protein